MQIQLQTCLLRAWRPGDEASLQAHADNPNVARNLRDAFPRPYTIEDAADWVRRHAGDKPQKQFAIIVDDVAAGGIGLYLQSDIFRRSAEIGYWLGERYWGRGIMSEAVAAVTRYAFQTFDLAHVYAGVFADNAASTRVLVNAGYVREGVLRQHVTKDGATMDEHVYGITPSDL